MNVYDDNCGRKSLINWLRNESINERVLARLTYMTWNTVDRHAASPVRGEGGREERENQ